ncbi:hypothetical protein PEBR_27007 [Penicillium brasilianum]|uniref:Uncharacterized protein n=1 Tax=Penicillium brasilianum TaxID=104259 RepID=A0A1S9RHX0_PENBI|nr:hypothetical protein PEBR_27007 [Penicillium brasilianum]
MPPLRESSPLEYTSTIMPPQSFQATRNQIVSRLTTVYHRLATRNQIVSRLTTVYHRLQYPQHSPVTVGEYLLELLGEIDMLKQIAYTEVDIPNKRAHNCCVHRLNRVQAQLREQALLIRGHPQGESYQRFPAIFSLAIEMIAVQIGRCIIKSHLDRDAGHMELKACSIDANLLCDTVRVGEMEKRTLKDVWRMLNAGVPNCRCHQSLRRRVQI